MKVSATRKYLMTSSNDNCVIIISSEERTHDSDIFLSESTLKANVKNGKFVKHKTLIFNDLPVYVLKEDMS